MLLNKIVVSNKSEYSDKRFKDFIGYKNYIIVRPLHIILPQMSGYIKYFKNRGKMSFMINDDSILVKYNKIWNKIKRTLNKIS